MDASFSSCRQGGPSDFPSPSISCCKSAGGRRRTVVAPLPDLALLDFRHRQRALLARMDQHFAEELAFRRMDQRVGPEDCRQVRQRAPGREQNAGAHHGVTVLSELSDHRGHGVRRQMRGTFAALADQCFRLFETQRFGSMKRLPGAVNRGVGGLDPPSIEDHRFVRRSAYSHCGCPPGMGAEAEGCRRRLHFFTFGAMMAVIKSGVAVSRVRCGYLSPP